LSLVCVHTVFFPYPYPTRLYPNDANNVFTHTWIRRGKGRFHRIKGLYSGEEAEPEKLCVGVSRGAVRPCLPLDLAAILIEVLLLINVGIHPLRVEIAKPVALQPGNSESLVSGC
jgi:hypothetical protein